MPRKVIGGLIQCSNPLNDESQPVEKIKRAMFDKHVALIEEAGRKGVQILCLQEIFNGPYFCPGQDARWYDAAEPVPGPTTEAVAKLAAKHQGEIGLATSDDGMTWRYEQIILRESFHLSHPYVFKDDETCYMMPECCTEEGISVYRAVEFPY